MPKSGISDPRLLKILPKSEKMICKYFIECYEMIQSEVGQKQVVLDQWLALVKLQQPIFGM
jgi:hypothetical protein